MKLEKLAGDRDLVIFDLETTGTSVKADRIVQFAGIKIYSDGRPREQLVELVNPGMPIPPAATEVHHISDADVADAPRFCQLAAKIVDFFGQADVGGYNIVTFDLPLLRNELERCRIPFKMQGRRIVDGMMIFKHFERRDLTSALKFYCNKRHEEAHDALGDVKATIDVIQAQLDKYDALPKEMQGVNELILGRRVTPDGRLVWQDGEACLGFGQHAGVPLRLMVEKNRGYLEWMLRSDFPDDVKAILQRALNGDFPKPRG